MFRENNTILKCVTFSGDNTNTIINGVNSVEEKKCVFSSIKTLWIHRLWEWNILAYILYKCDQDGADCLSVNMDRMVLRISNCFPFILWEPKHSKTFIAISLLFVRKALWNHCKTRWLSLLPEIDRILLIYHALKEHSSVSE